MWKSTLDDLKTRIIKDNYFNYPRLVQHIDNEASLGLDRIAERSGLLNHNKHYIADSPKGDAMMKRCKDLLVLLDLNVG